MRECGGKDPPAEGGGLPEGTPTLLSLDCWVLEFWLLPQGPLLVGTGELAC